MFHDIQTISPPADPRPYLRDIDTPSEVPQDPLERAILRLRLLHPGLQLSFRVNDLASLDTVAKKAILSQMRELLGVQPFKGGADAESRSRVGDR